MILVYCDACGRKLKRDCSDQVNIEFHAFGISNFSYINKEINLCVPCAELIVGNIDKLKCEVKE